MFSNIPQRFTAPFGLLPDAAKLGFRTRPDGLAKLATIRNIPESDRYWEQYVVLFDSASEVYSLITPQDIRRALLDAPENIATLIRVICHRLFNLISDHTFPASQATTVSSLASSFMKAGGSTERNSTKEVLNCIRVLQRVLPVVFEIEGETSVFELEVLWKRTEAEEEEEPVATSSDTPQFVIEDDEDSDTETKSPPQTPGSNKPKPKKKIPSLAEKLFGSIIDLMFCCGFTLPTKIQKDYHKINYVIWEKGVGSANDPGASQQYDSNKTEVLRLLLVLLSRQIYVSAASLFTRPSLYTLHLVQKTPRRDVLTILCSLLNTSMNSVSGYTTITSVAGKLPYNHLVFKGEDSRTTLVGMCLQVLVVLLDFQSGPARDIVTGSNENQTSIPTSKTNAFRYFLMKLHRVQDFTFIMNGVIEIMSQQMATLNNLLPGARKSIPYVTETIIFIWKVIELNKKFRNFMLESDKGMDLIALLLCYNVEIKDKQEQHGVCRAISYIIQTLSADPAFGTKLGSPVKTQLPAKYNTAGTAADFFIQCIYSIVATTSGQLTSLYPALIIALSNSAPYFKHLNVTSSARLIQLFTSFSNPLFLLSDEGQPRLLFFMLEVLNSVILHQLSSNPNLIYGILSTHKAFEDLGTFTLAKGLREIRAKEESSRGKVPSTRVSSETQEPPHVEKVRLLRNESSASLARSSPSPTLDNDVESGDREIVLPEMPMSPITAENTQEVASISEKARGKMRERRSLSLDTADIERAAAGVGRNGFVPTQDWVSSWQQGLPLDTVMLLISELLPKIQEMQTSRKGSSTAAIMDFLGCANVSHVLPPVTPVIPRRFMWTDASIVWLTSLIWGEIYIRAITPLGVWNSTNVRLFYVKHLQNQPRQITETMSSVVANVGGFLSRTNSSSEVPVSARSR